MNREKPTLLLVIPAFNEEQVLEKSIETLSKKLSSMIERGKITEKSGMVFVDDGSIDGTWHILTQSFNKRYAMDSSNAADFAKLMESVKGVDFTKTTESSKSTSPSILTSAPRCFVAKKDKQPHLYALKLSRNFGHQNALLAGLHFVCNKCDCAVSIDCDLQQDEEKLDEFVVKFQNGADIVLGVRYDRKTDSIFKKYSAIFFYKMMNIFGVKIIKNHADYRLLSHKALKNLSAYKETHLFLRAIVLDMGQKPEIVYFDVKPRYAGDSKYSLKKMLSFAWNGITSFSIAPLRFVSAMGIGLFGLSVAFGMYVLWVKIFTDSALPGWTSLATILCFLSGMQLLGLGIIGEYIGKMYQEIKSRPKYRVDECLESVEQT